MIHSYNTSNLFRYLLLLLFWVGGLCVPVSEVYATHRALVIGIGQQEDPSWSKINGDLDVAYVTRMLQQSGYTVIDSLKNRDATKAGLVARLNLLAEQSQPGDVVWIHFSGHGQQMTDLHGDEVSDRTGDLRDESWVTYDSYLKYGANDRGEKHISDDELKELFKAISDKIGPSGKLLVVVDACHSGDSSRGDLDAVVRGTSDLFEIPGGAKVAQTVEPKEVPWLTLAACASYQWNTELSDPRGGRLTYALYDIVQKRDSMTFEKVKKLMRSYPMGSRFRQTPQLEGDTVMFKLSDFFDYGRAD